MGEPARNYSWPPFESGNVAHVTHGARSQRLVNLAGEQVRRQLVEAVPTVADQRYAVILDVLVSAVVRHRLLHDYLVEAALTKGIAGNSRLWESANATGRLAMDAAARFGLSPTDEARLAETAANAELNREELLKRLTAQGRAIRQAAEARHALSAANGDGEGAVVAQGRTDRPDGTDGTSKRETAT